MRTLQELAREALEVQNACNLSGVARSFARAMADLCEHIPDTHNRNNHPIARLWADKIAHLTLTQGMSGPGHERVREAYRICRNLAEGAFEPEWPVAP